MRYFPLFLDLRERRVVIVGGGTVAERKAALLCESGAHVRIVAPVVTDSLRDLANRGLVEHRAAAFDPADLEGARLVIAATDAPLVNRAVAIAAEARGIPVNVVDNLELSTVIMPAIVDRSPLVIAISSGGVAPVLARAVKARIESLVDESLGRVAAFLGRWRTAIKARVSDVDARRRFYEGLLRGPVGDLVRRRRERDADELLEQTLRSGAGRQRGRVQLVGAGPGDPGLLTLNALRALHEADVILYDRLVSPEVVALGRREAQRVLVGKSPGRYGVTQERIHALMVEHAQSGRRVVRLKGGDPFVFARGGEELEALRAHGIDYEVVPGLTAAVACAAYAGIPLTHRSHSSSLRLVTAHCVSAFDSVDWKGLAGQRETLAIYMGVALIGYCATELVRHGRPPDTPIAFVENGSRANQRVVIGTLSRAAELAERERIVSPAMLFVGSVAALAEELHWFGDRPRGGRCRLDCGAQAP